MFEFINNLNPIVLAFFGGIFSFAVTILGSSLVFFFKIANKNHMNMLLSIAAGIMFSASFFSLLNPAISLCTNLKQNFFISVVAGFIIGGVFILLCNRIINKININKFSGLKKSILLFSSITLHNIPEGIAIGVAFGNILYGGSLISAISLTLGIAIQNFPEGAAVSLPLKRDNISSTKAFLFGGISGVVEPIFAVIGALLILKIKYLLSFILCFAAGAMIFVTIFDLIPESQSSEKKDLMAILFIIGFVIMMTLDVLLG